MSTRTRIRELLSKTTDHDGRLSAMPLRVADSSPGDATIADMMYGTVGSYDATNDVITTTGTPTPLPTGTPTIAAGVKVYDREGAGFTASDTFYAIKSEAVHTDGTHGQVDWVVIPTAAAQVNTYNVQLYNNDKARTDTVVEVKLLDASLVAVGSALNCYDPHQQFSSGGETDALGRATLVRDADTGATRLEFTHLVGPAAFICATLTEDIGNTTAGKASATINSSFGPKWQHDSPGTALLNTCSGMFSNLLSGANVVAALNDPDASTKEYTIVSADSATEALIAKITATVSARVSDTHGSLTGVTLGELSAGVFSAVLTGQTVFNPSLSEIHVPSGTTIQIPVVKVGGGSWVLQNAMDLQQIEGWDTSADQSVGHDASGTDVLWQDDGACS